MEGSVVGERIGRLGRQRLCYKASPSRGKCAAGMKTDIAKGVLLALPSGMRGRPIAGQRVETT